MEADFHHLRLIITPKLSSKFGFIVDIRLNNKKKQKKVYL